MTTTAETIHPIWALVCPVLKIQGGTIHQVAKEFHVADYSDLIMTVGDRCYFKKPDGFWYPASFYSYDSAALEPEPRVKCTIIPEGRGYKLPGLITGAQVRVHVRPEQKGVGE